MGCASSKEKVCRNCRAPYSPAWRSYSMPVHRPLEEIGDSYHMVALTSSTLGSLELDPLIRNLIVEDIDETDGASNENQSVVEDKLLIEDSETDKEKGAKEEFAMGMIEAKTWSKMINEKIPKIIPKTPIRTPPGEPETINAWEMMEGLEDISPPGHVHHFRSFSFQVPHNCGLSFIDDQPTPRVKENGNVLPKPLSLDSGDSDSNTSSNDTFGVSEFDHEVITSFRRTLEDLPAANPFHLKSLVDKDCGLDVVGEENVNGDISKDNILPRGGEKLIVYFTSLRGVRRTYEDCCEVRAILKGLGVKVDERDVSMHSGFREELKEMLGDRIIGGGLPRVFVGQKYIGGAEEIRVLNEEGKLEKVLEGCELVDGGGGGGGCVCEACGDVRFVPCDTCSGSCKIYYESDYDEEEFDGSGDESYGFHRCPDCNENGLKRCPICCD